MTQEEIKRRAEIIFNAIHDFNLRKYTVEDALKVTPIIIEYAKNREAYNSAIQEVCFENGCDVDSFSYQEFGVRKVVEKVNNVNIYLSGPNVCVPKR